MDKRRDCFDFIYGVCILPRSIPLTSRESWGRANSQAAAARPHGLLVSNRRSEARTHTPTKQNKTQPKSLRPTLERFKSYRRAQFDETLQINVSSSHAQTGNLSGSTSLSMNSTAVWTEEKVLPAPESYGTCERKTPRPCQLLDILDQTHSPHLCLLFGVRHSGGGGVGVVGASGPVCSQHAARYSRPARVASRR